MNQPSVVAEEEKDEEKDHPRDFLRLGPLAVIRAGHGGCGSPPYRASRQPQQPQRTPTGAPAMWVAGENAISDAPLVPVGMFVTPSPICFLILCFRLGEIYMLAMILFLPPAISLVFVLVPCVIIVMVSVMIFAVVSVQRQRRHCHGNQKGSTD